MKLLFSINHPAHYHLFKYPSRELSKRGHDVTLVIRDKDILEKLMIAENIDFIKLARKRSGKGRFAILLIGFHDLVTHEINMFRFIRKSRPDLMIGTDYSISHTGRLLNIPSLVFNEDDYNINKFFCLLAYPFTNAIIAPKVCDVGKYDYKKVGYDGYQKLSYLHPDVFQPDPTVLLKYFSPMEKYFLIRLVSFSAAHDIEMSHGGLQSSHLEELINLLTLHGKVYITSESKIPSGFEKYKLEISYPDIHHLLFFSSAFIADSQSMIVEAAMLGTPNIRFNSFVGKISVLEELEHKYQLTTGIMNSQPELLLIKVKEMIAQKDIREVYQERRKKMLAEKINVVDFMIWMIENYPASQKIMQKNPEYQRIFK